MDLSEYFDYSYFEITKEGRSKFVREDIVEKLPLNEREKAISRAENILDSYVGCDLDALAVLMYAAEKGRFNEFAEKLELHYRENLSCVPLDSRKLKDHPGADKESEFILNCYKELGRY